MNEKQKKKKGGDIARLLAKFCNRDCDAIGPRSLVDIETNTACVQ